MTACCGARFLDHLDQAAGIEGRAVTVFRQRLQRVEPDRAADPGQRQSDAKRGADDQKLPVRLTTLAVISALARLALIGLARWLLSTAAALLS